MTARRPSCSGGFTGTSVANSPATALTANSGSAAAGGAGIGAGAFMASAMAAPRPRACGGSAPTCQGWGCGPLAEPPGEPVDSRNDTIQLLRTQTDDLRQAGTAGKERADAADRALQQTKNDLAALERERQELRSRCQALGESLTAQEHRSAHLHVAPQKHPPVEQQYEREAHTRDAAGVLCEAVV